MKRGTAAPRDFWSKFGTPAAWISALIAAASVFLVAIPADQRSRAVATAQAVLSQPGIEVYLFAGSSPALESESDRAAFEQAGLHARVIRSPYQRHLARLGPHDGIGYLFFIIANKGPGMARSVSLYDVVWTPEADQVPPSGLVDRPSFGRLAPNEAYALLVDTAPRLTNADFEPSNAREICIGFDYTDLYGNSFSFLGARCLSEVMGNPLSIYPE